MRTVLPAYAVCAASFFILCRRGLVRQYVRAGRPVTMVANELSGAVRGVASVVNTEAMIAHGNAITRNTQSVNVRDNQQKNGAVY